MIRKYFILSAFLLMAVFPGFSFAQPPSEKDAQSLLSAFMSYTDMKVASVQKSLKILASTSEAQSGKWEKMKGLLSGYQSSEDGLVVWYARPDGTYFTVDKGLMDQKLSEREYFPDLRAGREVTGALVISKSTGQRSAVIAVPVRKAGKVIGAVGASLFLDRLSEQISSGLALRTDLSFYALAPNGLVTLHTKTDRHFLDPRELGSETLKNAAEEMLSNESGEVEYVFDKANKKAIYRTSPVTGWKFVLIISAVPRE